MLEVNEFNAIRISLASPDQIRTWSSGEVTKPETINYRTLRPEKDGLFDERIYGPTRDWECYCGKYKRIRYKGIICDKCGVEVTRSKVRRERMGHIQLASPVSHIWFFKGTPSRLGILLDMSPRNLERILYFALYVVTHIDEHQREKQMQTIQDEAEGKIRRLEQTISDRTGAIESRANNEIMRIRTATEQKVRQQEEQLAQDTDALTTAAAKVKEELEDGLSKPAKKDIVFKQAELTIVEKGSNITRTMLTQLQRSLQKQLDAMVKAGRKEEEQTRSDAEKKIADIRMRADQDLGVVKQEIAPDVQVVRDEARTKRDAADEIKWMQVLTEPEFREKSEKFRFFKAQMGAEAVLEIIRQLDMEKLALELAKDMRSTTGQRRKKSIKRLRLLKALLKSHASPEWMILTILPVIPPDLRPMVQLDGGRFATSDLNDLYRRVINRNDRLKRLLELGAPEIIIRNEKRMLQEAVDALMDNGRRGRAISGTGNHKLKSLSDMLRGKQGRFRQNLLGKRVDYSGRSVIVVGNDLKLHECGLPKKMALELFKPFVMRQLVERGLAHNIKSAKRYVERVSPEVWDVLEEVIKDHPVLLNRAPTLHRLGIQAFMPKLVEGSAIQIHPLVCAAFNADFDGDQMAVHVPLFSGAIAEAKNLMMSSQNILSAADGHPVVAPTQDVVLGCYWLTATRGDQPSDTSKLRAFSSQNEVVLALEAKVVKLQEWVRVKIGDALIVTTAGRVVFNQSLPIGRKPMDEVSMEPLPFQNAHYDRKLLRVLVAELYRLYGSEVTATVVNDIKRLGFRYATQAGITVSAMDIPHPDTKWQIIRNTEKEVADVERMYRRGVMTDDERYRKVIELWQRAYEEVGKDTEEAFNKFSPIWMMMGSGARGNIQQIRQLAGMRGLMADPTGRIIDLPIQANFTEGLTVLEYFISTHGTRKGLADTALPTADSGYLTRRLVDVAQDVIVREEDCGTTNGIWIRDVTPERAKNDPIFEKIAGRVAAEDISIKNKLLVPAGQSISDDAARAIIAAGVPVKVRSILVCEAREGVCRTCYGRNLATGKLVEIGEAVGVIAAQSIGEPGTQLTMRTFHIGGTASRVAEQTSLEAKNAGTIKFHNLQTVRNQEGFLVAMNRNGVLAILDEKGREKERYTIVYGAKLKVNEGDHVKVGATLVEWDPYTFAILTEVSGTVQFKDLLEGVTMHEEL